LEVAWTITALSKKTEVPAGTLRYWERLGLFTFSRITVTRVVIKPSFCSSEIADRSKVISRSSKETCSRERYSFTFVQNIEPGWLNTMTLLSMGLLSVHLSLHTDHSRTGESAVVIMQ